MSAFQVVYAPPSVTAVVWRDSVPRRAPPPPRQVHRGGRVVHPLMMRCAELCENETWRRVFERAARNKLPHHFALKEDRLSVRIRRRIVPVALPSEPELAMAKFIEFVEMYGNVYSDATNAVPDEKTTKNALTKNLAHRRVFRRNALGRYIRSTVATPAQQADMAFTLHTAFQLNIFRSKDIAVDDDQLHIVGIRGLRFSDRHKRFDIEAHKFVVPAFKRKVKPTKSLRIPYAEALESMRSQLTLRIEGKQAATNPPPGALAEDDDINMHYITLSTDL